MPKILIIAPSWVGDTVMAQPLFRRLHESRPGLSLDAFAPPWVAPVLERMPEISRVIPNPFGHGQLRLRERWQVGHSLRQEGYAQAILLPNSLKSALVPLFAGIPLRTGYGGEWRSWMLTDARRLDKKALPLMVERFAALADPPRTPLRRPVPNPRLTVNEAQRQATLARLGLSLALPVAALCVGAEYGPAKRWPAPHFAELARRLAAGGYRVWLLGSPKDRDIGEEIEQTSAGAARNLCGRTDLGQAVDLLSAAAVVVSNDSGLMHVAAALDRPMAALYGSSSPGFTPPLSARARIVSLHLPCSPCFKRECPLGHFNCMMQLTPERVMQEIAQLEK